MAYLIFLSIIAVFSGFALYITRTEKRSFRSWSSEQMLYLRLNKKWFGAGKDPEQFLKEQAIIQSHPYQIPTPLKIFGYVERKEIAGLDCVILKGRSGSTATRILYLHGGAYVEQPILPHWLFLDRINTQSKAIITVPIYPKAPTNTFEEAFYKVFDLYQTLLETTAARNIVIMGDSAGGGLALALAQQITRDRLALPKAVILISPWLDITLRNADITPLETKDPMLNRAHLQYVGRAWVGDGDPHDWRVSPINGILEGLPPLTLFVGTHEILLADARKLRILCQRKGVALDYHEYPKMNHDFPLFPIPEAREAQAKIVDILLQS